MAAKFGLETCQESVDAAISCLYLAGSRSKCKHFLRVCQPKEGLTLLSFPQRVEPKDRSHQRADTGIHNEDNSNLYNSPISKG